MRKRFPTSIVAACVFLSAGPAGASHSSSYGGIPIYNTVMFTDATRTTVSGKIWFQYCTYDEVTDTDDAQYRLQGTYTMHQESSLIGYCMYGDFGPIH